MITYSINGMVRPRVGIAESSALDIRIDEAVAVRRCAMYRKAFRGMGVSYPVGVLDLETVASWIRSHGMYVDVASEHGLDRVRMAQIDPSYAVMHCRGEISVIVRRAELARFIVASSDQVAALADNPLKRKRRILVDVAGPSELAAEVAAEQRLQLVGLFCRIDDMTVSELTETVVGMIARMAWIRRTHAAMLSSLSLDGCALPGWDGDPRSLRRVAGMIDQAVEDGCIRYRCPRPVINVSPRRSDLQPN